MKFALATSVAALVLSAARAHAQSSPPPTSAPPPETPPAAPASPPPPAAPAAAAPVAPAPAPSTAPPAASPPAPVPTSPAPQPNPAVPEAHDRARVLIRADRAQTSLELRPFGELVEWRRACLAPCGDWLSVEGMDARIVAPGMTASKAFRIKPGQGAVTLSVDGGSESSKTWGQIALASGLPVALAGMGTYAIGMFEDRSWMKTTGGITAGLGAALVLTSLPLLLLGTTEVREGDGKLVAGSPSGAI